MKKNLLIFLTLVFLTPFMIKAKELKMEWQKNWGGSDVEKIKVTLPTKDNGIVVIGQTQSTDINNLTYGGGFDDSLIVKYDKDGNLLWQKLWGGSGSDVFNDILQTGDGGFIIVGESESTDIEGFQNKGSYDAIVLKYDKDGNLMWQKSWGGNKDDFFYGLSQTKDGGYITFGYSYSTDIDGLSNKGSYDAIVLKYDKDGNLLWQKNWGGNGRDHFKDILQTGDGGIVIVGYTNSTDIEGLTLNSADDAIIVKFDKNGNLIWQKSWCGDSYDTFSSIISTLDGGFIVSGYSYLDYVEGLTGKGEFDAIIVKYDKDGNMIWQKLWGGSEYDEFLDLHFYDDGSFIVMGTSSSDDIEGIENKGRDDAIIVRYDKDGNVIWQSSYGNEEHQRINSPIIDRNGNLIICIESFFVDEGEYYNEQEDVIIISYDKDGNVLWQKTWDGGKADRAKNLLITDDNSLYVLGNMRMFDSSDDNIFILKYSYEYDLEIITTENGTSTAVQQGKYGIITPTPNEGYEVDKIIIKDKDGNVLDVEVTNQEDGTYSFELYTDVSVEVIYKEAIENPKTGILDVITIIFIGFAISISGFFIVKRYNERLEF